MEEYFFFCKKVEFFLIYAIVIFTMMRQTIYTEMRFHRDIKAST